MKSLKMYLIITASLLTTALVVGVVVWYLYQRLPGARPNAYIPENTIATSTSTANGTSPGATTTKTGFVLTADKLTPGQRAVLESFGMQDAKVAVTEATIACAKEAVGEARFAEILNGSAPSPLEALKLVPCIRK